MTLTAIALVGNPNVGKSCARRMTVDAAALSAALGAPVVPAVATGGEGIAQLTHHLPLARSLLPLLHYDAAAEGAAQSAARRMGASMNTAAKAARVPLSFLLPGARASVDTLDDAIDSQQREQLIAYPPT